MKRNKKTNSTNFNFMLNKAFENGKSLFFSGVEKAKETVSTISDGKSILNMDRFAIMSTSNNLQETNDYKLYFQNLNALDSKLEQTKETFFNWEFLEKNVLNYSLKNIEEDESFEEENQVLDFEKIIKLNSSQVLLFGRKLGSLGLSISLNEEDGTWTEIKNLFKLTKEDVEQYTEAGYFEREIKLNFSNVNNIIDIVDNEKNLLAEEILTYVNKVNRVSSKERSKFLNMTSRDLTSIENSLKTIRVDFYKYLNQSIIYDLIESSCDEFLKVLETEDGEQVEDAEEIIENFLSEESIVINYSLDPGREFDRNVCEESYLVKDAMQQLGLFDLTIEYNEDNTINLNLELSGKKLMNIEEAIEKSRKELKNKCMNKLSTLVKSII